MSVDSSELGIVDFWKKESKNNIKPNNGKEFPEGWDIRDFLKNYDDDSVIEVGCGYGRLCGAFSTESYKGIDLSQQVIEIAKQINPTYNFDVIEWEQDYPKSTVKLVYTVLLHMNDVMVEKVVKNLCNTSKTIVLGEIMDRKWRNEKRYPLCYNRNPEEYKNIFEQNNFNLVETVEREYIRYENTNVTFQVYKNA